MELRPVGKFKSSTPNKSPAKNYAKWTPVEVNNLHHFSDSDTGPKALHHTLGPGHGQASPGDHNHDGVRSKKIGTGLGLTLTGSKGGNVALTNLITMLKSVMVFTDNTT